jgi:serine/threonine protein kinase
MNDLSSKSILNYKIQETIGKGVFSSVYKAVHLPTRSNVALKVIDTTFLSQEQESSLLEEIYIHQSLYHPFIADFLDFFQFESNYIIVMEYVCNGNLSKYIRQKGKLDEKEARRIFMQLLLVLQYLHDVKNVVHRNLSIDNLLLDENYNIRLIDFGLSFYSKNSYFDATIKWGSPFYVAPEIIHGQPYSNKCENWSAGVILYCMVSGDLPFTDENHQQLYKQIIDNEPNYSSFPQDLTEVLKGLLTKNPQSRISLWQPILMKWFSDKKYHQLLRDKVRELIDRSVVDKEITVKLQLLGIDCQDLQEKLLDDEANLCTISYRILKKKKIVNLLNASDCEKEAITSAQQMAKSQIQRFQLKSENSKIRVTRILNPTNDKDNRINQFRHELIYSRKSAPLKSFLNPQLPPISKKTLTSRKILRNG